MTEESYTLVSPYGTTYQVKIERTQYTANNNTAINLSYYDEDLGSWLPYAHPTVNLDDLSDPALAYLDTNNMGESIVDWFKEHNFIEPEIIGYATSGFCRYPLVRFTPEFMELTK